MSSDYYFNKREEINEQRNTFLQVFHDDIAADIETIQVTIKRLRLRSKDFYGFDFSLEVEDIIQDLF